jgi:hypothetical protein
MSSFLLDDVYSNNERVELGDVILRHPVILEEDHERIAASKLVQRLRHSLVVGRCLVHTSDETPTFLSRYVAVSLSPTQGRC